jgi:bile acid-coenzyme A ligase
MTSFGRQLTLLAEQQPTNTAIVHVAPDGCETTITWADLERRANQVGRLLAARGAGEHDLVAVALPDNLEHFYACYGTWKLGATVLPLRPDTPPWERERVLAVANPRVIVSDWNDVPYPVVSLDDVRGSVDLDGNALPDRTPEPAQAIATSGSTGTPKLIVAPGRGDMASEPSGDGSHPSQPRTPDALQLVLCPLYHTNGFASHNWLRAGRPLVLLERFDPERVLDYIERLHVNFMIIVPTMMMRIARVPGVADRDFSSLHAVLYGGAPAADWLIRVWLDLVGPERFWLSYGGTERFGICFCSGVEWLAHPGTVGRPMGSELRVLDEAGAPLPPGEVGELFMRSMSPGPPSEYVGAPPARSTDDGLRTYGDLGWVDDDGYVYIADRRVDMIITGGANVFPAEVEAAITEHPGVRDVAVVGLADPEWGRRVHAIIEPVDPNQPPTEAELREHCRARLAAYKVPKSFEIADQTLRTEAGKINRSALVAEREAVADTER